MSHPKSDPTSTNVLLSSLGPDSVNQAYDDILGAVERNAQTAISWGLEAGPTGSQEICKH